MTEYVKITILSADVLTLNSSPVDLVAAPGVNKYIVPVRAIARIYNVTVDYDTAVDVYMQCSTANKRQMEADNILDSAVERIIAFDFQQPTSSIQTILIPNDKLVLTAAADPTNGDGDLDIHLWYEVLTIT